MSRPDPCRPSLAYVVHTLNPGGTEKLVVEMSLAFAADYDVAVVCLDEPGSWAAQVRASGIPVHCVWRQPGFDLTLPGKLARLFRRLGTRIIHAHQCTPWLYAALSRLWYRAPRLLFEEHGRFYPEVEAPGRAAFNRLVTRRLTHRFVAVSEDIRRRLVRYEGLDARRIDVVYNGVALAPPALPAGRGALRASLGFAPDDFVVGTVGRFDPIKNLPMLVDAIARARRFHPQVRGLLVGDGPERAAVEQALAREGLPGAVVLTGFREDARLLVQALDLFVLASHSEGTSMALLEAMGAGVPVAVTEVGGNPEVVAGGLTGWLVPSGDAAALAGVIAAAVRDPARAAGFAAAGRQRFADRFSFERMLGAYRVRYRELLARRVHP